MAVDSAGNLYIADNFNRRIRRVDAATGIITTVAGGSCCGLGDGGPATSASLSNPFGVAVDPSGILYIADTFKHRVRKVTPSGIISTVAGNGIRSLSGDGGPATNANLNGPSDVMVDLVGNLFIVDTQNDRVRKVWATVPGFVATPPTLSFTAPAGSPVVAAAADQRAERGRGVAVERNDDDRERRQLANGYAGGGASAGGDCRGRGCVGARSGDISRHGDGERAVGKSSGTDGSGNADSRSGE